MGYDTGSLDGPKFYVVVKKRHNNLYYRRLIMDKYIGFDIDSKKTIACVVRIFGGTFGDKHREYRTGNFE